jgi:hypothetical protein
VRRVYGSEREHQRYYEDLPDCEGPVGVRARGAEPKEGAASWRGEKHDNVVALEKDPPDGRLQDRTPSSPRRTGVIDLWIFSRGKIFAPNHKMTSVS